MKETRKPKKKAMDEAEFHDAALQALETYDQDFEIFFLARLIGATVSYTEDACVVTAPVRDFLRNPQGSLHGGIVATLLDMTMGHLLKHLVGVGVTLDMTIQYLRPVKSGEVRCEARLNKRGRTINCLEARMFDADGKLAAMATSTWHRGAGER